MIVAPANQIFDHTCQHFFGVSEKWSDKKRMGSNEAEKIFECDLDLTISHCSIVDDMCHEPEKHGIHCKLQIRNIVPGKLWRSLEAMSSVLENIMHLHPPLKHTKTFTLIPDSLPKEKHDESWSLEKSRIHPQQIHYPNMYHPKSSPRSHQKELQLILPRHQCTSLTQSLCLNFGPGGFPLPKRGGSNGSMSAASENLKISNRFLEIHLGPEFNQMSKI